jgi:hypothetical protein
MIKKNLYCFILLSGMTFGLMSCLEKGGNRTTAIDFAIMVENPDMNALAMHTSYDIYAAPELQNLEANSCILADFTIDYDNQPSNQPYYTASNIKYQLLPKYTAIEQEGGDMVDEYSDSIQNIQTLAASPLYNGHIFVMTVQAGTSNYVYDYELIFHPDSVDAQGINTIFLKSKLIKGNAGNNLPTSIFTQAFDLSHLIDSYGKDTIFKTANYDIEYKYLPFNLKYQKSIKENLPVYVQYGNSPVIITVYK